jgi:hypothetical protein
VHEGEYYREQPEIKTPSDHAPVYVTETQSSILEQLDGLKTNLEAIQKALTNCFDILKKYPASVAPGTFEYLAKGEALVAIAVLRLAMLNVIFEKEVRK